MNGKFQRWLFHSEDIEKSAYLWNTLSGLLSAGESVFFSMIVSRLIGLSDAGIVTFSFTFGVLMATIGKSGGVRTLQVTDVRQNYSFPEYFGARLFTVLLMVICSFCYLLRGSMTGYTPYKTAIISLFCLKYVIESVEDVLIGECQKQGRLDVGAKLFVFRSGSFIVSFTVTLYLFRNIIISLIAGLIVAILLECLLLSVILPELQILIQRADKGQVTALLKTCISLGVCTFSFFYITNAPKYVIDRTMNDEIQACYSFISMPVFAIELLSNFIYQPSLVAFAENLKNREYGKVKKRIFLQMVILCGLTVSAIAVAYFWGIPVLSLLFATDLTAYKAEMLLLVLNGGLLALMGYFSTVLTAMEQFFSIMYGYLLALIVSFLIYTPIIQKYGLMGGIRTYCLICSIVCIYEFICITCYLKKGTLEEVIS